jgi:PIN domain nuclease of toxin-antitoxin system
VVRALLDTHAFLWWITDSPRLSSRVREIIADGRNELFFSAASGWEIAIKARLGRLEIPGDLERSLTEQLSQNAIQALPIYLSHALRTHALPNHHRDPFDRLLVSQAILERLTVLSADVQISRYPVEVIW